MPAGWSEDPFQGGRLLVVSSDGGRGKGTLWGLFNRDTNPIYEAPPCEDTQAALQRVRVRRNGALKQTAT